MPASLKVHLSEEEDNQLLQLKQKAAIPQRVRDRAEIVRLNSHGWSVAKIAEYMNQLCSSSAHKNKRSAIIFRIALPA